MTNDIIELVRQAGVVGAGGAGFPTHVKISSAAEYVIINGAECEPLLRVDQQLMLVEAERIMRGIEAVMTATGAGTGIIGVKAKHKKAIAALEAAAEGKPIRIFKLGDFFPAGDEQVLVYEVLGRVVPGGGIPIHVGCVVCNVETILNVANALEQIPVTHTFVTITGEVAEPITLKLPIGMSIADVLALAGVKDFENKVVIDGGPMMGKVMADFSQSITKITKGLIVLSKDHQLVKNKTVTIDHIIRRAKAACVQCVRCTDICPRNLLGHNLQPHKIMRGLNYLQSEEAVAKMTLLCCECGACELYGCIMGLSPRQVNATIKKELSKQGVKLSSPVEPSGVTNVRDYRKIPSKRLVAKLGLTAYDQSAPITTLTSNPEVVRIPLRQHIGAASVPVVKVGQRVERGTLIASIPEKALGANIHASIDGIVQQVGDSIVIKSDAERGVK